MNVDEHQAHQKVHESPEIEKAIETTSLRPDGTVESDLTCSVSVLAADGISVSTRRNLGLLIVLANLNMPTCSQAIL
jgi:hypothetical protein